MWQIAGQSMCLKARLRIECSIAAAYLETSQKSVIELYCESSYQLNVKKCERLFLPKTLHHSVLTLSRMSLFWTAHICGESKPHLEAVIHMPQMMILHTVPKIIKIT